jgi:hypothetical protein
MTVEKITEKWGIPKFMVEDQNDILRIIASNISDVQQMGASEEANDRLNKVKELIFDLMKVKK